MVFIITFICHSNGGPKQGNKTTDGTTVKSTKLQSRDAVNHVNTVTLLTIQAQPTNH